MRKAKKHFVVRRVGFFNEVVKDGKVTVVCKEEYLALRRMGRLHFLEKESVIANSSVQNRRKSILKNNSIACFKFFF